MNKTEYQRRAALTAKMAALGFAETEIAQLRRISNTLSNWAAMECNGDIEIDEDTNKAWRLRTGTGKRAYIIPNRYNGAISRLAKIEENHPGMRFYIQSDPRWCAVYLVRSEDVPEGCDIGSYYTRGIAIY